MSKDPAFLFYSADFLVGTMMMTREQVGSYIRLLCMQHQQGHLPENHMVMTCNGRDDAIWSKFVQDEQGNYYNVRLEEEITKRLKYADSRRLNGVKGGRPSKETENHMDSTCFPYAKPTDNHSVNENINDIDVVNLTKKRGLRGKNRFDEFYQQYPKHVAKQDAEKAFSKLKPDDALFSLIMASLAKFTQTEAWTKDGGKYIPNPATWLNGRRWEDDLKTQIKPQSEAERIMQIVSNHKEDANDL